MSAERALRFFLRAVGGVSMLAVFCAVMPFSWMDSAHRAIGLGPLPPGPVVEYLARSTSAFYALFGGLFWVMSCDLVRYRPMIRFIGAATLLLGLLLLVVDWRVGLPRFWRIGEGPFDMAVGAILLWLGGRVSSAALLQKPRGNGLARETAESYLAEVRSSRSEWRGES